MMYTQAELWPPDIFKLENANHKFCSVAEMEETKNKPSTDSITILSISPVILNPPAAVIDVV